MPSPFLSSLGQLTPQIPLPYYITHLKITSKQVIQMQKKKKKKNPRPEAYSIKNTSRDFPGGPVAKRPHSQCRRSKLDHHTLPLKFPYVAAKTQHSQINNFFFFKNRPEPCQCKVEAVVTAAQGQLCFSDLFPWIILLPWHSFASKGPDRCLWNVYVYVHLHTSLCIRVYTYLHTCVYRYTCIYVYFWVSMHRDSHRVRPCNPPGAWCQDTQIPNSVNAQVPYKQVPASPVSTSSVSLSAGSTCHWLEIDTQSFKCVTKHDYKGKENNNALYFCKTFYRYQKLLHLLLSCFIPNLWGRLPACLCV